MIGCEITQNDLMDILFYCPFDLEAYLEKNDFAISSSGKRSNIKLILDNR